MADVKFDIEVTGIKELKQAADNFNRLGKVSSQLAAQYKPLGAQTTRLVKEQKRLEAVHKSLGKAMKDGLIDQKQATRAMEEEIRVSKERILTDKTLIAQAKKRQKAADAQRKETDRLTKAYAPLRAAEAQYKATQKEIQQAHARGVINLEEMQQALALVSREFDQFNRGVATGGNQFAKFNVETYKANQRAKRFASVGMQQAGYQVGDFIVQIQSGTDALVAFGQQGSQLAGIFGPKGAIIGAVIAAGTAIGMIFKQASEAAEGSASEIKNAFSTVPTYFDSLGLSIYNSFENSFEKIEERYGKLIANLAKRELEILKSSAKEVSGPISKAATPSLMEQLGAALAPGVVSGGPASLAAEAQRSIRDQTEEVYEQSVAVNAVLDAYKEQVDAVQTQQDLFDLVKTTYDQILAISEDAAKAFETQAKELGIAEAIEQSITDNLEAQATYRQQSLEALTSARQLAAQELLLGEQLAAVYAEKGQADATALAERQQMVGLDKALVDEALRRGQELIKAQDYTESTLKSLREQTAEVRVQANFSQNESHLKEKMRQLELRRLEDKIRENNLSKTQAQALRDQLTELHKQEDALDKLIAKTERLNKLRTPFSTNVAELSDAEYQRMLDLQAYGQGKVDSRGTTFTPPKGKKTDAQRDAEKLKKYIDGLENQRDKEKQLVGIFDEQRDLIGSLIDARQKYGDIASESQMKIIEGYIQETHALEQQQKALEEARKQQEQLKETISSSMEGAFMSIVDGTKSVEDAFKDMARQIIAELYRVLVVKRMVAAATSFFGFADGGVFNNGNVVPFANGGVVGGPTYFPMSSGRTGLMGEAGPEAIMPLKRGKNGKLGVESSGQGNNITVNQTINVSTGVQQTVRTEIKSLMPQIAESAKSAVMDAKRRGGTYGRSFA